MLIILFWRDKDISTDVVVRPDGKISLLLVNEVQAAGLTPEELRLAIIKAAAAQKLFTEEPTVSVGVKQINSRKVYITGAVGKPGPYPLNAPLDDRAAHHDGRRAERVRQARERSSVIRTENGDARRAIASTTRKSRRARTWRRT